MNITMRLIDGRSKAFGNLKDAVAWMKSQETPRNSARITVSLPEDLKDLVRAAGPMSTAIRALLMKATGARWTRKARPRNVTVLRKIDRRAKRKVLAS